MWWNKEEFGDVRAREKELSKEIKNLDAVEERRPLYADETSKRGEERRFTRSYGVGGSWLETKVEHCGFKRGTKIQIFGKADLM